MTSLRTFQTEIEEIHNREIAKQRIQPLATATITDKGKENGKSLNAQSKGKAKDVGVDHETDGSALSGMPEVEEKILVLSVSRTFRSFTDVYLNINQSFVFYC